MLPETKMLEGVVIRRRNRLKKHFVNTSNVLLYGYKDLSDGAKLTYQVIDSFDWEDGETGTSKGYTFPSLRTIAKARGKSWTTVWRHIEELIAAGLITKHSRAKVGKPSILIIEEVSKKEQQKYLEKFVDRKPQRQGVLQKRNRGVLQKRKAKENRNSKENEKVVNENESILEGSVHDPVPVSEILKRRVPTPKQKGGDDFAKREYLAGEIVKICGDEKSLGFYRKVADKCPDHLIFQALSVVKETARQGRIRASRGALFVDLIKRFAQGKGIELDLSVA
jgi:DNA-binding transcriptional regulator YhcF (GntR family)